jgi:hypothetical protein
VGYFDDETKGKSSYIVFTVEGQRKALKTETSLITVSNFDEAVNEKTVETIRPPPAGLGLPSYGESRKLKPLARMRRLKED